MPIVIAKPDIPLTFSQQVIADGAIGYWKLDDSNATAVDSTSNSRNGSYVGTLGVQILQQQVGPFGALDAVQFVSAANNSHVVNTSPDFDSVIGGAGQQWTFECWVKYVTDTGFTQVIMDKTLNGISNKNWNMLLVRDTDLAQIQLWDGTSNPSAIGTTNVVTDGIWHHLVGVRDIAPDEIRIYVDGVFETSSAASTLIDTTTNNDLLFGKSNHESNFSMEGLLSNVVIYDTALAADKILAHASATS